MDFQQLQAQRAFHMHQKVTVMANRYSIFADDGTGGPGPLVAFVQQKRLAFKEQVTFYSDENKQFPLLGFKARKVIDLSGAYDVTTPDGNAIGLFGKKFGQSILRSTWEIQQPGHAPVTGTERSMGMAVFRRLWGFIPYAGDAPFPWKYHFDLLVGDAVVGAVYKKTRFRDHYLVTIDDPSLDRRLVLAQAVAMDALQSR